MKKVSIFLFMLTCCSFAVKAQHVVSSAGYEEKKGITVNWILGGSLEDLTAYVKSTIYEPEEDQLSKSALQLKFTQTLLEISSPLKFLLSELPVSTLIHKIISG